MQSSQDLEFTAFVREHGDALLRYARYLTPDRFEAEDLLQSALLRLATNWHRGIGSPLGYVRTTLVNLCRDGVRRRHLVPVPAEVAGDGETTEADRSDAVVAQARLDHLLAALPVRQRLTVVLRVLDGYSEAETAALLDCSIGTVKSNLSRGLRKLQAVAQDDQVSTEGSSR